MSHTFRMSYYEYARKHYRLREDAVFIDSHASSDLGGNMYYIARQILSGRYGRFKLYISVKDLENLPQNLQLLQREFPSARIKLVVQESAAKYYALAVSKYLFTDVQLSMFYVKRPGQVIVQTWHGTPLKKLGYSYVEDVAFTGGQKKSFIMADYNLFPNEYTMEHMIESYRLSDNLTGTILLNGYPRNAVFFDRDAARRLRIQMELENKRVYAYMPTWRGALSRSSNAVREQAAFLKELERKLAEDQVFYVKLHRLVSQEIDFSEFKQIRQFPQDRETYEFLAAADCLITDYSSVMFDFLCTRKKIILYTYDREQYLKSQGTYINMDELPFPQVDDLDQLIKEMAATKQYDDTEAYNRFCPYDNAAAAQQLCEKVIWGSDVCREVIPQQSKERNTLLYGGNLHANINTQRFVHYLDQIQGTEDSYCVTYKNTDYFKYPIRLQAVVDAFDLQSVECFRGIIGNETLWRRRRQEKLFKADVLNERVFRRLKKYYAAVFEQQFYGNQFDRIISFPGTPLDLMELFLFADVREKIFYVDTKMMEDPRCAALMKYAEEQNYSVRECGDDIFFM